MGTNMFDRTKQKGHSKNTHETFRGYHRIEWSGTIPMFRCRKFYYRSNNSD